MSPYDQDISKRLLPPVWSEGGSWEYIFGTDGNGRDYLADTLWNKGLFNNRYWCSDRWNVDWCYIGSNSRILWWYC